MVSTEISTLDFNVDLDEIEALNQKRTLAFINHWVYHTVQFVNQFSRICHDKLFDLEIKLRRASDALAILESKLASIPGLDDVGPSPNALNSHLPELPAQMNANISTPSEETQSHSVLDEMEPPPSNEQPGENKKLIPVSSHPRYASFFKMVSFGVPKEAVKLKMSVSGLDPSILDDPSSLVEDEAEEN